MKISTNLTEIKELFVHHLGINVSELELTIESEDGGWIINTKTTNGYPATLKANDLVEVEYNYGANGQVIALSWDATWNTNNSNHIVKYRKVN